MPMLHAVQWAGSVLLTYKVPITAMLTARASRRMSAAPWWVLTASARNASERPTLVMTRPAAHP
eukprot:9919888-Alexandrium_andersonii.AAC.1